MFFLAKEKAVNCDITGWFSPREDGWIGSITIIYFTFGRLPNQENL
jgi:hypothetical protein